MKNSNMTRYARVFALSVLTAVSVGTTMQTTYAQDVPAAPAPVVRNSEVGHAAKAWIELQSSNAAAAPARPMLGEEAGLAYRRYMESFKSKIPDLYGSALNQGGGGGGGSGSGSQQPSN
ncbi:MULTISPECIES: DUF3613 domain-containing protein [Paraburkholderia]|uniref:DUF3613 domain-containing protein n=1 Tax=Paraburkholderia TaxID=1822464 RepID=UPI00225AE5FC|nr:MULTISPECIES: DUF3613 domain-containing protein [Paraburkholderia]MCX4164446.1 DUF3613 domain-containing protein [Paraburkholderia megapolitana]MDN7159939.1 DUF3613 domain-containing protein [Paraburkholderia sp. CHISQ3]MDQ6496986.1 DUF3613 domain-containing protein [Paraburkholderia megapolitana]